MIGHPSAPVTTLTSDQVQQILTTALEVLEERGLTITSASARKLLGEAGYRVDEAGQRVTFPADKVMGAVGEIPSSWTLQARNPKRNVDIGIDTLAVAPGYGCPFIADIYGHLRPAMMVDFCRFTKLAAQNDYIDITGGLLVEPNDVACEDRAVLTTRALLSLSDKPLLGSVASARAAEDSLALARIVFGDIRESACMLGLININSPLMLDATMAEVLMTYVRAGQPVILTPGIIMGVTAPVTLAAALAQAFAELLGCCCLAQAVDPRPFVIIGLGGFAGDLHRACTAFGRPEQAIATLAGAQIARWLELPFRCSGTVTNSPVPDCRSGYEHMLTSLTAWHAGAHVSLQGAGVLHAVKAMSYEQFVIDLDIWGYILRLARGIKIDETTLSTEIIIGPGPDFLSTEHTFEHMRLELYDPPLLAYGHYDLEHPEGILHAAQACLDKMTDEPATEPLDEGVQREMQTYIQRSHPNITDVHLSFQSFLETGI